MTLLMPEEIDYEVAHISPEQVPDYEKVHDVLVAAGARAQLRKVIAEIEALEIKIGFRLPLYNWTEAAKKELQ